MAVLHSTGRVEKLAARVSSDWQGWWLDLALVAGPLGAGA